MENNKKTLKGLIDEAITLKEKENNPKNMIRICDAPIIFKTLGINNLDLFMTKKQMHIEYNKLKLKKEILYNLSKLFNEAVMIFKAQDEESAIIVMLNEYKVINPLLAKVILNGEVQFYYEKVKGNIISKIYYKKRFNDYVKEVVENKKIIYMNNELVKEYNKLVKDYKEYNKKGSIKKNYKKKKEGNKKYE